MGHHGENFHCNGQGGLGLSWCAMPLSFPFVCSLFLSFPPSCFFLLLSRCGLLRLRLFVQTILLLGVVGLLLVPHPVPTRSAPGTKSTQHPNSPAMELDQRRCMEYAGLYSVHIPSHCFVSCLLPGNFQPRGHSHGVFPCSWPAYLLWTIQQGDSSLHPHHLLLFV